MIVAHFYDVESGRKDLDARGRGRAHEQFAIPIPRDGGIADLLAEAGSPNRRFAAVICESIERVARRTYFGTKIEYELEQSGVALCAADEPILTDSRAKRATPTLTRRVKQAVSEWYVLQMLELAWDGFIEHTHQGWNIGKPPYGYLADKVPHPVPARREQGASKHRLVPDPVRGPVVTEIFRMRVLERLSCARIAQRLNLDLATYPPPEPNRVNTTNGQWTASAVRSILENPKYTGYQVWNRRARKKGGNKANPVSEWIWSPHPTHEPLVTRALFDAAWPPAHPHPGTQKEAQREAQRERVGSEQRSLDRSYLLRSYVFCTLCQRRMFGKHSKSRSYYACQPKKDHHRDADWYAEHPKAVWISERVLVEAVHDFFAQRIFGPQRRELLAASIARRQADASGSADERQRLQDQVAKLDRRKERLLDQLDSEDDDGDPQTTAEFRRGIRRRYDDLERQRRALLAKIAETEAANQAGDEELLDAIPQLSIRLGKLPEAAQREIYNAFQLQLHYRGPDRQLQLQVTISAALAENMGRITKQAVAAAHGVDQPFSECPRQEQQNMGSRIVAGQCGVAGRHGDGVVLNAESVGWSGLCGGSWFGCLVVWVIAIAEAWAWMRPPSRSRR
ncbi:recombinase family protein [Streptomyces sp. NPDC054933]